MWYNIIIDWHYSYINGVPKMNNPQALNSIDILIGKHIVSYQSNNKELVNKLNTGLKNLVYPQFAAELAAENALKEIGISNNESKLVKIDNTHWKLIFPPEKTEIKNNISPENLTEFLQFESNFYDFYRFSSLVKDILIYPSNISIPYDTEMQIIYTSYRNLSWLENSDLSPYEQQLNHIKNDMNLIHQLKSANEA